MESKQLLYQVFLILPAICSGIYLPLALRPTLGDWNNQLETSENISQIVTEVLVQGSGEEISFDCGHGPNPEEISNCDLLIETLRDPILETNDREFCCTLLSSQSVRSNCCRQVRDWCSKYNDNDCPKPRRRILPPKAAPIVDEPMDVYNGTMTQKLILSQNLAASELPTVSKSKRKQNAFTYYKTKKGQLPFRR